jgi:hypothetical protein
MATLQLEDTPMALAPTDDTATLRIYYQADGLLPAADVAPGVRAVAAALERDARRRGRFRGQAGGS